MEKKELKIPYHIAIILDGNGRWAKEKGKTRSMGHKAGFDNIERLSCYIFDRGVSVLSVYAFSTENFKREASEVAYLMNSFVTTFEKKLKQYHNNNIKVIFSGRKENLRSDVLKAMEKITEETKNNTRGIFNICLNYGGQYEIVDAVKKIVKDSTIDIDALTPELFSTYLYQNLPPIDFLIRTSGEYRLSNFMMYQASYAEFYFTPTYFPDFNEEKFEEALEDYTKRDRRFGGIKK